MKSRSSDTAGKSMLPPPPAPTSRDANPWSMSSGATASTRVQKHPRAPKWPRGTPQPAGTDPRGQPRTRWLPLGVLLFIAGTGVKTAIDALESGELESAAGALVILAMVALMAVRLFRRRSR